MKVFYGENETYVVAQNQQELMDYLFHVDCYSENPVRYSASIATAINNHPILVVDIKKYHTSVSFPLIIADGVNTDMITRQYDSLETFRYNLKEFFEYLDVIATKVEKEKDYINLLKKLTKTPITKPTKPTKVKTEINPNEFICNRAEQYLGTDGMIYTRYIYTRGGI